jgi:hypothetical protein
VNYSRKSNSATTFGKSSPLLSQVKRTNWHLICRRATKPNCCGLLLALSATFGGCSSSSSTAGSAQDTIAKHNSDERPWVDSPDFLHWNQFPTGTKVVRVREVINSAGKVTVTTTLTIASKSASKIVVDQQITVLRPENGGEKIENPSQPLEYVARFRLPKNVPIESFSLPSMTAKRLACEKFSVLGQEFNAEVFEWQDATESGPMEVKLWRSELVPGRILKEESRVVRENVSSTELLTKIEAHTAS